ncbi:MAG: hypothetical protein ABIZ81_10215 [Opitutaceae bacterium]
MIDATHSNKPELTGSLYAHTAAEGHLLARRLAAKMLNDHEPSPISMAEMLRRPVEAPSNALVTAIYFHAIAIANRGWST